ncbi:RNA polymerase sigma factor [Tepidicaulis sp.]|jgi:RNA polymerase sigma-70 factor (ECF subfamily)|uniref:RNA polymerase sigma factor n=1 Tax=Tepidicaulis sp. TaxID=1920809 RepID=UPI003B5BEAFC
MSQSEEDRQRFLIARIAAGDEKAFAALYETFEKRLFAFIRSKLNDPHEAADILHEIFMDVWRKAGKFEGRSKVSTWLMSIAFHKTVDRLRKKKGTHVALDDEAFEIADEGPGAADILQSAQEAAHVKTCLDKLPDVQRLVLHMAFFEELSYARIGEVMDRPEGTIKTRVYHAKQAMKKCLGLLLGEAA